MSERDRDERAPDARDQAPEHENEDVARLMRVVRDTTTRLETLTTKATRTLAALKAVRTQDVMDLEHAEALMDFRMWKDASNIRFDLTQALEPFTSGDSTGEFRDVDQRELDRLRIAVEGARAALVELVQYAQEHAGPAYKASLN